ncbi:MAG: quinol:cytochrome C oxidoreductase [Phycisphaerae bacterium]
MDRPHDISQEPRHLAALGPRLIGIAGAVGVLGLAAAALLGAWTAEGRQQLLEAYLVNYCYFLSLALGALFFVMLQHVTRAGWSVVLRRLAEGIAATLPLLLVLVLPILFGLRVLYPWASETGTPDALLAYKRPYLNAPFFAVRIIVCLVVWSLLAWYLLRTSVRQDATGEVGLTLRMQRVSAPGLVIYAVTVTVAAFDLLMSLDPYWYSTIFGVYFFAGGVVGFFALLALVVCLVQHSGRLVHAVTTEHYHDIGKLVFAFIVFWAYIAFSQYLLIWYANVPEETVWYRHRQTGPWVAVSLILLFGHFVVPFVALISRRPKRRKTILATVGVWVLVMHWCDVYWLARPSSSPEHLGLSWMDLACFVGIGGLCVAAAVCALRRHALLPESDPRLHESLTFENV